MECTFYNGISDTQGPHGKWKIPSCDSKQEVRNLFVKKIREWLSDVTKNDGETLDKLCNAFVNKELEKIEEIFGDYLWNTISIRDTAVAKEKKENFYHGILLGLLGYKSSWLIKSNAESGTGYSDILVEFRQTEPES